MKNEWKIADSYLGTSETDTLENMAISNFDPTKYIWSNNINLIVLIVCQSRAMFDRWLSGWPTI